MPPVTQKQVESTHPIRPIERFAPCPIFQRTSFKMLMWVIPCLMLTLGPLLFNFASLNTAQLIFLPIFASAFILALAYVFSYYESENKTISERKKQKKWSNGVWVRECDGNDLLFLEHGEGYTQRRYTPQEIKAIPNPEKGNSIYAFCLNQRAVAAFKSLINNPVAGMYDIDFLRVQYESMYQIYTPTRIPFDHVLKSMVQSSDDLSADLREYLDEVKVVTAVDEKSYQILRELRAFGYGETLYLWLSNHTRNKKTKHLVDRLPNTSFSEGYDYQGFFYINVINLLSMLAFGGIFLGYSLGIIYNWIVCFSTLFLVVSNVLAITFSNSMIIRMFCYFDILDDSELDRNEIRSNELTLIGQLLIVALLFRLNLVSLVITSFLVVPLIPKICSMVYRVMCGKPLLTQRSNLNAHMYLTECSGSLSSCSKNQLAKGHSLGMFSLKEEKFKDFSTLNQSDDVKLKDIERLKEEYDAYYRIWDDAEGCWLDFNHVLLISTLVDGTSQTVVDYIAAHLGNGRLQTSSANAYDQLLFCFRKIHDGITYSSLGEPNYLRYNDEFSHLYQAAFQLLGDLLCNHFPNEASDLAQALPSHRLELIAQGKLTWIANDNTDQLLDQCANEPWAKNLTPLEIKLVCVLGMPKSIQHQWYEEMLEDSAWLSAFLARPDVQRSQACQSEIQHWLIKEVVFSNKSLPASFFSIDVLKNCSWSDLVDSVNIQVIKTGLQLLVSTYQGQPFERGWRIEDLVLHWLSQDCFKPIRADILPSLDLTTCSDDVQSWFNKNQSPDIQQLLSQRPNVSASFYKMTNEFLDVTDMSRICDMDLEMVASLDPKSVDASWLRYLLFHLNDFNVVVYVYEHFNDLFFDAVDIYTKLRSNHLFRLRNHALMHNDMMQDDRLYEHLVSRHFISDCFERDSFLMNHHLGTLLKFHEQKPIVTADGLPIPLIVYLCSSHLSQPNDSENIAMLNFVHRLFVEEPPVITFKMPNYTQGLSVTTALLTHNQNETTELDFETWLKLVMSEYRPHHEKIAINIIVNTPFLGLIISDQDRNEYLLQDLLLKSLSLEAYLPETLTSKSGDSTTGLSMDSNVHRFYGIVNRYCTNKFQRTFAAQIQHMVNTMSDALRKMGDVSAQIDISNADLRTIIDNHIRVSELYKPDVDTYGRETKREAVVIGVDRYEQEESLRQSITDHFAMVRDESEILWAFKYLRLKALVERKAPDAYFYEICTIWGENTAYNTGTRSFGKKNMSCRAGIRERGLLGLVPHIICKDSIIKLFTDTFSEANIKRIVQAVFLQFSWEYQCLDVYMMQHYNWFLTFNKFLDEKLLEFKLLEPMYLLKQSSQGKELFTYINIRSWLFDYQSNIAALGYNSRPSVLMDDEYCRGFLDNIIGLMGVQLNEIIRHPEYTLLRRQVIGDDLGKEVNLMLAMNRPKTHALLKVKSDFNDDIDNLRQELRNHRMLCWEHLLMEPRAGVLTGDASATNEVLNYYRKRQLEYKNGTQSTKAEFNSEMYVLQHFFHSGFAVIFSVDECNRYQSFIHDVLYNMCQSDDGLLCLAECIEKMVSSDQLFTLFEALRHLEQFRGVLDDSLDHQQSDRMKIVLQAFRKQLLSEDIVQNTVTKIRETIDNNKMYQHPMFRGRKQKELKKQLISALLKHLEYLNYTGGVSFEDIAAELKYFGVLLSDVAKVCGFFDYNAHSASDGSINARLNFLIYNELTQRLLQIDVISDDELSDELKGDLIRQCWQRIKDLLGDLEALSEEWVLGVFRYDHFSEISSVLGKEHEDYEWFQTMMLRSMMQLECKPASIVADQRCGFSIFDQPAACLPLQPETHSLDEEKDRRP